MENAFVVSILKWLFPSLVGAILAVYYKSKTVGWSSVSSIEKFYFVMLGVGSVVISVILSYYVGGAVCDYFEVPQDTKYASLIHLFFAFSGIKIVDALANNIDIWLQKGIETLSKIIDKILGKF